MIVPPPMLAHMLIPVSSPSTDVNSSSQPYAISRDDDLIWGKVTSANKFSSQTGYFHATKVIFFLFRYLELTNLCTLSAAFSILFLPHQQTPQSFFLY